MLSWPLAIRTGSLKSSSLPGRGLSPHPIYQEPGWGHSINDLPPSFIMRGDLPKFIAS